MSVSVLLVTFREPTAWIPRSLAIEAEGVLGRVTDLTIENRGDRGPVRRWRATLDQRAPGLSGRLRFDNAPSRHETYDLLLVHAVSAQDLLKAVPLGPLVRRAGRTALWIHEQFARQVPNRTGEARWWRRFDALFVGMKETVVPMQELTQRPVSYLLHPLDVLAWAPPPDAPPRVVDLFWYGSRVPATHKALVDLARRHDLFYLFDTVKGRAAGNDISQHRRALIDISRRTRVMIVNPAKAAVPQQTGGQLEIGYRYVEAAAAGAVMAGGKPLVSTWERFFGWHGALHEIPVGSDSVEDVVMPLLADGSKRTAISARSCAAALRTMDMAHRWQEILGHFEMPEGEALRARLSHLESRAREFDALVQPGTPAPATA